MTVLSNGRSRSITAMSAGASGYHGYMALPQSQMAQAHSATAVCAQNRGMAMDEHSDDNLSQATMDSLPRSVSSSRMRHNGSNGKMTEATPHQSDTDSLQLPPYPLEKKPSKKKKLLNMFRKSPKPKAN
jgi:hypothetical protein